MSSHSWETVRWGARQLCTCLLALRGLDRQNLQCSATIRAPPQLVWGHCHTCGAPCPAMCQFLPVHLLPQPNPACPRVVLSNQLHQLRLSLGISLLRLGAEAPELPKVGQKCRFDWGLPSAPPGAGSGVLKVPSPDVSGFLCALSRGPHRTGPSSCDHPRYGAGARARPHQDSRAGMVNSSFPA